MRCRNFKVKKATAMFLAALLCVGMLPASVLAEEEEAQQEEQEEPVEQTAGDEAQDPEGNGSSEAGETEEVIAGEVVNDKDPEPDSGIELLAAGEEAEEENEDEDDEEDSGIETLALDDLEPYPNYSDVGEPSTGNLEWGITHSKEATNLEENPDTGNLESTVTLRVQHDVDVVIVQDGTNLVNATDDFIKDLANQTDVHINCGMVIFGGTAPICWTSKDLYDLSVGTNVEYLIQGLEEDAWQPDVLWNHSGSNLQAGLREAERMLEDDDKLTSSDKYIVFMSDCAARMWLNDDDEVMAKSYMIGDTQWFFDGTEDWIQRYGRWADASFDRNSDPGPDEILYAYPHTFQEVWNAGQAGAPIDEYTMTFEEWQAKRDAGDIDGSVRITNAGSAPHSNTMEEYYTSYEASTYHTAEEFVKAAGMANIELVTFSYRGYPLLQYNYGEYIDSFQGWLGDLDNITRYEYLESDDEGQTENESYIFEHILDQIKSTEVGQGTLIDEIGKTDEYDLDFIDEMERFHLIAGKDEYPCTKIEATDGATSAYGFGDPNGSDDGTTYPFILRYYKDGYTFTDPYDGTTTTYGECFAIEFNTTISGFYEYVDSEGVLYNGVSFTYDIYLTNPKEEAGVYGEYDQYGENDTGGLYTNNVAEMYPISSSGTAEPKQVFPLPTVSYRTIEVEKEWEDEDDADGIRPDDITAELLKDGKATGKILTLSGENGWHGSFAGLEIGPEGNEVASVTVTEGEDWSWVFDNLDKYYADGTEIEYTYVEDPVEGYNTTVNGDTVTNTKTVNLSGSVTWKDDNDAAGARPDSVTLHICANGVRVRKIDVTVDDGWKWSCDGLDKYDEDGNEIVYTVTEDAVKGYTSEVNGYNATNTYKSGSSSAVSTISTNEVMPLEVTSEDISGSINWYDGDDADGNRPERVTVTLYREGETGALATTTTSAADDWEFTFEGNWAVMEYDAVAGEYGYYVEVSTADGYSITTEYSVMDIDIDFIIHDHTRYLTCTVTYIASKDISGSVTWADNNNEDKIRPESLTVYLYANGVQATDENGDPISVTVSEADDWAWTFEGVDKYSINSISITYTIAIEAEGLGNYNVTVQGYNVTCVESTSKTGSKTWNDGNNADGSRPKEITIHIYEGRAPITYSVREVSSVDGYTTAVTGNEVVGFVITNTHTPEETITGEPVPDTSNPTPTSTPGSGTPKTGDTNQTGLWLLLLAASAGVLVVVYKKRFNNG